MGRGRGVRFYFILFLLAETVMAAVVCLAVYRTSGMDAFVPAGLLAGITLLLASALVWIVRRKMMNFSSAICSAIDAMMDGQEQPDILLEETLLDKINHRLLRLYEMLRDSRDRTDREHKALQQLLSDISHQLKTPVANILMINSTLLDRDLTPEKQEEFLRSQQAQLHKLEFLMDALVKTSRLESGVLQLQPVAHPVSDTIAQALGGIVYEAEKKRMDVRVQCDDSIIVLHDRKWTAEALLNLLDNAVKYTEPEGRITISVEQWEVYTKIDIADTGKGILESRYGDIFQRFYREPEVSSLPGIGVGLYLAREIIVRQGGYIVVSSQPQEGSTFSVFLPSDRPPAKE